MKKDSAFISLVNNAIANMFKDALKTALKNPAQTYFILKTINWQKKAQQTRQNFEKQGVHIPPFMILSVTGKCNLKCKGCYALSQFRAAGEEMSLDKIENIVRESKQLGISIILIGGGEPLLRKEVLDIFKKFPEIIFVLFTNGLLFDDNILKKIETKKNVIPVISLEGHEEDTDNRRGKGVYQHLQNVIEKIKNKNIFWGISLTITKTNFHTITDDNFIKELVESGSKLFFYVEYIPVKEGTESIVPTKQQRKNVTDIMGSFRKKFPALFIAFPGDEEMFGGCLSSGRGFVHINPSGDLEPCPFAPYSDVNLNNLSLKEALQSQLLSKIRQNHDRLTETSGGCALWTHRDWVRSLLNHSQK